MSKGSDIDVGSIEKISQTSDKNVANIEEDVKILENFCEFEDAVVLTDYALTLVQETIKHILAELEQKDKRIQELEEKVLDMIHGTEIINKETPEYVKENYIPKQVVIDKIEEIEIIKQITSKAKYTHLELLQFAINNLEELLEK